MGDNFAPMTAASVAFAITPLAKDDPDRAELSCIWCNLRGCDGTIALLGGGRTIVVGLHARCLEMHERVERARAARATTP